MELLALFDADNNVLNGYIERNNKMNVKSGEHFKIILLYIINSKGQYLIQKPVDEDRYATTGGHVTYGEDAIETVIKEAKEELGLDISISDFKKYEIIRTSKAFVECFYMEKDIPLDTLKLQEEEVESVNYLSIDEINNLNSEGHFNKMHYEALIDLEDRKHKNDLDKVLIKVK